MKTDRILPVGSVNWHKNLEELSSPKEVPKTKEEFIFDFMQFREEKKGRNLLNCLPWRFNRISVLIFFFCYLTQSWVIFALTFYVLVFYNIYCLMRR